MTITIQPHPDAPEGLVSTLLQYEEQTFHPGSLILCRNTAPLVAFAYQLLLRDVPCKILGRDIGAQLSSLVKKMRPINLDDLESKLDTWCARESAKAIAELRDPERINDQYECVIFFINSLDEASRTVDSLLAKIELMFTDDRNGESYRRVTLSTIHKAKGLEFPTVFLLNRDLLPSRFAKQEWQVRQEYNLLYVAVTRSKDKFYYIKSDNWKDGN